ncbi:MAG: hypothetical protein A2X64_09985 [Ignavibacteria bacterium GWF2_33_9]|nr:MAG: hypothetical protein A2X64_09985 [Ignavibacteria bacterium GWF2_33_9]
MLNNKNKFTFFIFSFFLLNLSISFTQRIPVEVNIHLDSSNVLIGDQIHLLIKTNYQKNYSIFYPNLVDSLGHLIIIRKTKIDTLNENDNFTLSQTITLTSFDSGTYEIPPIEVKYKYLNDTVFQSSFSNSVYAKFFSVDVDTTQPIKDIKPPLEVPFSIWDYIWYIIGVFGIVAAFLGAFYFFYKRKPKLPDVTKYDPKIPPHVQALSDLNKLEQEKLWQSGKVKEYYSILTDILRLYLERRFGFPALELTTGEIMAQITSFLTGVDILSNIKYILENADMVKFAKSIPIHDENTKVMILAKDIVESTIPIDIENEEGGK